MAAPSLVLFYFLSWPCSVEGATGVPRGPAPLSGVVTFAGEFGSVDGPRAVPRDPAPLSLAFEGGALLLCFSGCPGFCAQVGVFTLTPASTRAKPVETITNCRARMLFSPLSRAASP